MMHPALGGKSFMRLAERILGVLLIVGSLVTAYYWWSYFHGGDVRVIDARWYTAFESSFPIADGWMALCGLFAGVAFLTGSRYAGALGLLAASAIIYLTCMDVTFDVENGMYALAATNDAMKFEVFINGACAILGLATLWISWRRIA
jgi:hypothetical protein